MWCLQQCKYVVKCWTIGFFFAVDSGSKWPFIGRFAPSTSNLPDHLTNRLSDYPTIRLLILDRPGIFCWKMGLAGGGGDDEGGLFAWGESERDFGGVGG